MVYVDEKEQKCEVQYCVVLREGEDKGLKHYVWASRKEIKEMMEKAGELLGCSKQDNETKIICRGVLNGADYEITFNPSRIGSLELGVGDLESARDILLKLSGKT